MKTVFVHPERCIGCRHCEMACAIEHSESKELFGMIFETPRSNPRIHVDVGLSFLTFPNRCRHCDPAPCMQVCPTAALHRDVETGSVLVNYDKCIGCAMCAMVCPFDIISFHKVWNVKLDHEVNVKCDHCIERQRNGEIPACVEACKTGALEFGDANAIIRSSRKDFTLRTITALKGEEAPSIPANLEAFREVMAKVSQLGPLV
ncbi:electron transport protein HydN [bacterium BMS3Abin05]|nr:electron transport protein HydN [bacterium BMS3Abin05]HDZ12850.1 4Fe-4S dicluster domain-containing protein [Bacteroidota bacterium]